MLLFPNGEHPPGLMGGLMGGALVALSSGTEAAWINPAGMSKEVGAAFSMGRLGFEFVDVGVGGKGNTSIHSSPGSFAWVSGGSKSYPRLSLGFFSYWPVEHELYTQFSHQELTDQSSLPQNLVGSQDLDLLFPAGISREENSNDLGKLQIFTAGWGIGMAINESFRIGFSMRLEKSNLQERSVTEIYFSGDGEPDNNNVLSAYTHSTVDIQGDVERMVYTFGIQFDLAKGITSGITLRPQSRHRKGMGSIFLARTSALALINGDTIVHENSDFILIDQDNVSFMLQTPREIQFGLAFYFDDLIVELDIIETGGLAPYQVVAGQQSNTPSTTAFQTDPVTTSLERQYSYALGFALLIRNNASVFFGFSHENSGVPKDDFLFRNVDISALSTGYYYSDGPISLTFGLIMQMGEEAKVRFPLYGEQGILTEKVDFSSTAFEAGASFIF